MAVNPRATIRQEIVRIRKASAARDPWAVLGIPPKSAYDQIKSAQRRWIRRLHPDRWHAHADERFRMEIQEAFYQVQSAYFESLKQCAAKVQPVMILDTDPAQVSTPAAGSESPHSIRNWLQRLRTIVHR